VVEGLKVLGILSYTYLQPPSRVDEVIAKSWQQITAIHDEGDGIVLCA
jgi:hypothetical protein